MTEGMTMTKKTKADDAAAGTQAAKPARKPARRKGKVATKARVKETPAKIFDFV